ncbi:MULTISPECIES: hypothetical protein [unclassified Knoellia]|uniref:hypothetical protein n=1 Tax=Knoellia altitudinis TaxID=3404795 RepID=UPI00361D01D4
MGQLQATGRGAPSVATVASTFVARGLPWVLCAAVLGSYLEVNGTAMSDLGRYAGYLAAAVALPGVLILRALVPSRRPWVEDVVLGTAVGMAAQLALLVLVVALGVSQLSWLRWWPALVVLPVLLVPRLRRRCLSTGSAAARAAQAPGWWHWGVAGACLVAGAGAVRAFLESPLPPGEGVYYVDLPWHLALVHAATRSVPLEVPQVAGTTVEYHWFADGDMAAASVVSGVPEAVVLLRLWPTAVVVTGLLLVAVLARALSGTWAAGVVAAWIFAVLRGVQVLPAHFAQGPIVLASPSHGYVAVMTAGAMVVIVWALRGQRIGWGGWLLLVALLAGAGGSKPAALPTLLCGAALTSAMSLLVHRRWDRVKAPAMVLLACAALLPLTAIFLSGSDSETSVRLFDFIRWHPTLRDVLSAGSGSSLLPAGVADLGVRSLQILGLGLLAVAFPHVGLHFGAAGFALRSVRADPVAWFVAGTIAASFAAFLIVSHPAFSQVYFVRLALVHGAAVLAWILVGAARRAPAPQARRVGLVAAGALVGAALAWLTARLAPTLDLAERSSVVAWRSAFLWSMMVFVGGLGLIAGALLLAGRRQRQLQRSAAAVLAGALVLGAPAYAVRDGALDAAGDALRGTRVDAVEKPRVSNEIPLPAGGGAAMHWLDLNTPRDAVVATNRHCSRGTVAKGCVSNLYLVSGLGGRQAVLESWAYVSVSGGPSGPSPYPERLAANDALFTDPTPEGFERMKQEHGLGWLVADATATPVSPRITEFATPRFSAGTITVYEVR